MKVLWQSGSATAEEVRQSLSRAHPMKESTVRTILRRIEEKGFLKHRVDGRTYVYEPLIQAEEAAVSAVRQIIDRFCEGSVETLLVGMVDAEMVDPDELSRFAKRIDKDPEEEK
jgi:predicted transcriptional regulator